VVAGSEKLSSVKLAHFLVKKQNGLCEKKGPTRQEDFKEKLMSYEKRGFEKTFTPLHVITSRTVFGVPVMLVRYLVPGMIDLPPFLGGFIPVPGTVLLGPRVA